MFFDTEIAEAETEVTEAEWQKGVAAKRRIAAAAGQERRKQEDARGRDIGPRITDPAVAGPGGAVKFGPDTCGGDAQRGGMDTAKMEPLVWQRRYDAALRAGAEACLARLRGRRSVRDFAPDAVPREVIETCIRAAGTAPSGANLQPWHFVAVGDPEVKRRLREAAEAVEREFYERRAPAEWKRVLAPLGTSAQKPFLETAPWLIVIFALHAITDPATGERHQTYYPKESVGIATGLLIAALHEAGLATLTHTPSPMGFLNEILGRPATEKPFLLLVVGHPAAGAQVPVIARKVVGETATFL